MKSKWEIVKIGDIAFQDLDCSTTVKVDELYSMVGVYSYGKGLFHKEDVLGINTSYKTFYKLKPNHIVLSQLFGWEGAIALSSTEFKDKFVSSQFPVFLVDEKLTMVEYVSHFLNQRIIWKKLFEIGKGMGSRRRTLNPDSLLSLEIPLPAFEEQKRIVEALDLVKSKIEFIRKLRVEQAKEILQFYQSTFENIKIQYGENLLSDALELNNDTVPVDDFDNYHFAGVYCFGNGLFVRGSQDNNTSYSVFNRLHKDHIVMSKVKGWEGAIALITGEFEGMFLSPVYPTFKAKEGINIKYISEFCKLPSFWKSLLDSSSGIGARRNSISEAKFLNSSIPLPPLPEQDKIVELFDKIYSMKENYNQTIKELEELFPALLDKAFKGEL